MTIYIPVDETTMFVSAAAWNTLALVFTAWRYARRTMPETSAERIYRRLNGVMGDE